MNRTGTREELLDTLREIVSGHSAQLITEQLHIHRQTLVFRKKGLEKILGVDLDSSEVVLNIAIALKMMSMAERDYSQSGTFGGRLSRMDNIAPFFTGTFIERNEGDEWVFTKN